MVKALTIQDAAAAARRHRRSIERAIAAGELVAYRVGDRTRILESDLLAYLTARPVQRTGTGRDLTPTLTAPGAA